MVNKLKICKEKLFGDKKLILIAILVLIITLIIAFQQNSKVITLKIEDKCGKFINVVSHTIDDENACISRCRSQCNSIKYAYKNIDFRKNSVSCNSCLCYCR